MKLNSIPEIVEDIRQGRMVVLIDDEDRENEGDLVMAASMVKPEDINWPVSPPISPFRWKLPRVLPPVFLLTTGHIPFALLCGRMQGPRISPSRGMFFH